MEEDMKKTVLIISLLLICLWVAPAFGLDPSPNSMETLREEAKAGKKALPCINTDFFMYCYTP